MRGKEGLLTYDGGGEKHWQLHAQGAWTGARVCSSDPWPCVQGEASAAQESGEGDDMMGYIPPARPVIADAALLMQPSIK